MSRRNRSSVSEDMERRMYELRCKGLYYKDIGARMGVSARVARYHIKLYKRDHGIED